MPPVVPLPGAEWAVLFLPVRRRCLQGHRWRPLGLTGLLLGAALLAGCGVPGEPLPPLLEIPAAPTDLAAEQVGNRLRLSWTVPQLTTEGTRVRRLERIDLYAVFSSAGDPLADFSGQARLLVSLPSEEIGQQERIVQELPLEAFRRGQQAAFAVKAVNDRGKDAGFSNLAATAITDLPQPPSGLRASVAEPAVQLTWQAAEQSAFGGPAPSPDGYHVFRRDAGSPPAGGELGELIGTVGSPAFQDENFAFGRSYVYAVRAFRQQGESLAVTPPSEPVTVAAVDRFPPARPQALRAVAAAGAVELVWSPNPEADLGGYYVYRGDAEGYTILNSTPLRYPLFRDTTVIAGSRYNYRVTAVDQNGNPSVPSATVSILAE